MGSQSQSSANLALADTATSASATRSQASAIPNFPLNYTLSSGPLVSSYTDSEFAYSHWNEQHPKQGDYASHTLPSLHDIYEDNRFIDPRDTYHHLPAYLDLPPVMARSDDVSSSGRSMSRRRSSISRHVSLQQLPTIHTSSKSSTGPEVGLSSSEYPGRGFTTTLQLRPALSVTEASAAKPKRRAKKERRNWTDGETEKLIRAVSKHGIGKWTTIAKDPAFVFNDRSAADLKDRFRTCAPTELLGHFTNPRNSEFELLDALPNSSSMSLPCTSSRFVTGSLPVSNLLNPSVGDEFYDLHSQDDSTYPRTLQTRATFPNNILNDGPEYTTSPPATGPEDQATRRRKKRSHRRTMEDIAKLGIVAPFKRSQRRGRRRFGSDEDTAILKGLLVYGPQWSKIRNDPLYACVVERHPTDLRDRIRNRYPEIFKAINNKPSKRGVEGFQPEGLDAVATEMVQEHLQQLELECPSPESPGNYHDHDTQYHDEVNSPTLNAVHLLKTG